jgi:alpha-L-fucosidase
MKTHRLLKTWVAAVMAAIAFPALAEETSAENPAQRDARMAWWREAKFGMFIHWGLYAVPAGFYEEKPVKGIGEWIMKNAKIPVATYAGYTKNFNPTGYDADKWVKMAKDAGMKYIVITTKHHDGFAMFASKASSYNIMDATPFKRDPIKELAAACQKEGVKLGFYYSQCQDWHHPGGSFHSGTAWDKAQEGNFDDYLDQIAIPQVKEILTQYGPVAVLWWDTPNKVMTPERSAKLNELLKLQPGIIHNNRLGGGFKGDTDTPEQHIPATGFPGRDWEACMTMNDTWGFKSDDHRWKSTPTLLFNLIDIASKGGNYLLNVGPTAEGIIPAPSVERLAQVGQWMKVNGESIYGTQATPFGRELGEPVKGRSGYGSEVKVSSANAWRCTRKPGKLYIHLFEWPQGSFILDQVDVNLKKAYLLADPAKNPLPSTYQDNRLSITLPEKAPDAIASVLVLEIDGEATQKP